MNFLLFVVLPALVIGAMTHYSAGVEAFLILCAVWLRDLTRDNQQQAERKQQDNKLRDLQNELDILHQRINHLRQPENDLPADAAARESLRQPENRLSVSQETARQPETRVTPAPASAQPSTHLTTPQPVHPSQSIGQPEIHPTHPNDEFNLDALDAPPAPAQSITQPPAQPALRQPETATAAQTPVHTKPQPRRQPETAWQNNEAEAESNPL
ncbi:hypothetical protein, partial [Kingella oralis]